MVWSQVSPTFSSTQSMSCSNSSFAAGSSDSAFKRSAAFKAFISCFRRLRSDSSGILPSHYLAGRRVPPYSTTVLQRQVRHLHDQRSLKRDAHRCSRGLACADAFQKVLDVEIGGPTEAFLRFPFDRDGLFRALAVDLQIFAADVHAGLVAVELIELVVADLVLHRGVVDAEDADEVFGVLGGGDDALGLIDAGLVGAIGCGGDSGRVTGVHQHVDSVEEMCALVGEDAAGVVAVESPLLETVRVERMVGGGALPLLPIELAFEPRGGRLVDVVIQPPGAHHVDRSELAGGNEFAPFEVQVERTALHADLDDALRALLGVDERNALLGCLTER